MDESPIDITAMSQVCRSYAFRYMHRRQQLLGTANYLRHLLNTRPKYRQKWLAHARRSGGSPNIDAVSRVLTEYHWSHHYLFDWDPPSSHRGYKDRVARTLAAEAISPQTLQLFVEAFDMSGTEHDNLLTILTADDAVATSWVPDEFPAPTRNRGYHTLSLHELHVVGDDGLPRSHRTIHTIQALEDGVDHHIYAFDTPDVEVRAFSGATAGPVEPLEGGEGFWCCELRFHRPLSAGQIRYFEYGTEFAYTDPPPPEMRRGSMYPLHLLSIRVEFGPGATSRHDPLDEVGPADHGGGAIGAGHAR